MISSAGESVVGQQAVGALRHLDLAFAGVGLPALVEEHHHGGGSVAVDFGRTPQKLRLALLQRDGVDHRLALHDLEAAMSTSHFDESIITGTRAISAPRPSG